MPRFGASRWTEIGRGLLRARAANPSGFEITTIRSMFYEVKAIYLREHVASGGKGLPAIPSYESWGGFVQRFEEESGRTLEDLGVFREPRGYFYVGGQLIPADSTGAESIRDSGALLIVEKGGPAKVLARTLAGTSVAVLSSGGVLTHAHLKAIKEARATGKPVLLLRDFDSGGEVVARGVKELGLGVRSLAFKDFLRRADALGVPLDVKALASPDPARWRDVEKTIGPEAVRLYRELGEAAGLPPGMLAGVSLDAVLSRMGAAKMTRALGQVLDDEYPRATVEKARPRGPSTVELLMARMAELTRALERHRAERAKRPAAAPSSWLAPVDPLEAAARGLLRQADALMVALEATA